MIQIDANKAVAFLLRNEYHRFRVGFERLQAEKTEDQKEKVPDFDKWLKLINVTKEESKIIQPNNGILKKL